MPWCGGTRGARAAGLAPHLPRPLKEQTLWEALVATRQIEGQLPRAGVLATARQIEHQLP